MIWSEFISKITEAKEIGQGKGLSVPSITTLIYSGAFDSMIAGKPTYRQYAQMFEELKSATKSKASLPAKRKTDLVGIKDIDSEASLNLWRYQINPLATFDLLGMMVPTLKTLGFEPDPKRSRIFPIIKPAGKGMYGTPQISVTQEWASVMENPITHEVFKRHKELAVVGIVTEAQLKPYGDNKKRLVFRMFTGSEPTGEIVLWPERESGNLNSAVVSQIEPMAMGVAIITPNEWNGKYSGFLKRFIRINL